jgi:hypothetical protein
MQQESVGRRRHVRAARPTLRQERGSAMTTAERKAFVRRQIDGLLARLWDLPIGV